MPLRNPADWMVFADDRILEYLEQEGAASPKQISDDPRIHFSRTHTNNRLSLLRKFGLVNLIGNGVYEIREEGREYLAGELDAAELEPGE